MLRRFLTIAAAIAAGLALGFFGDAVALFSDGNLAEAMTTMTVVVGLVALVGFALGAITPSAWRVEGVALGIATLPPFLVGLERPLLVVVFGASNVAAALFGAWAGARIRSRRQG